MTRQFATPPVSLAHHPSDCPQPSYRLYDTPTSPSDHPPLSHRLYDNPTHLSDHPPPSHHLYDTPISPSACPSPADCLTTTMTHPPIRPSFSTIHHTHDSNQSLAVMNGEQSHTIHHTQDSSQSLAVVNGEQSCKAKKFHRAFTNYDLPLQALDASSISNFFLGVNIYYILPIQNWMNSIYQFYQLGISGSLYQPCVVGSGPQHHLAKSRRKKEKNQFSAR